MDGSLVGAVILHFRNPAGLKQVLDALAAQTRPPHSILVVDNSLDESIDLLQGRSPDISVVKLPSNNGYGDGMNVGIEWTRRRGMERLLLLTHDCMLAPNAVALLEDALVANPQLGVVGPMLLRTSSRRVWSAGGELRRFTRRGKHLGAGTSAEQLEGELQACAWLDGAALMYRREALDGSGVFRTEFFLYEEELEHHLRLADSGWGVACVREARASQDTLEVPPYLGIRNHLLLCRYRSWPLAALATVGALFARELIRALRTRDVRRLHPTLMGAAHACRGRLDRDLALRR